MQQRLERPVDDIDGAQQRGDHRGRNAHRELPAFPSQQTQEQIGADQPAQQRRERDERTLVVLVIDDRNAEGAPSPWCMWSGRYSRCMDLNRFLWDNCDWRSLV